MFRINLVNLGSWDLQLQILNIAPLVDFMLNKPGAIIYGVARERA
jgi:hypothetical protein